MYEVTSQQVNCGPCATVTTESLDEANAIFDRALANGAIFAEVFDFDNDSQLRVEFPRPVWV